METETFLFASKLSFKALNGGNELKSFCCRIAHKMPLLLYSEDFSGIHESPWSRNLKGVTDLKTHWMSKKICQSLFGQAATKSVLGQTVLANGTSFSPPPPLSTLSTGSSKMQKCFRQRIEHLLLGSLEEFE